MTTTAAPTIADARRAAEALAAEGVARVVLFGSVARGEATERSDIDLVAIYDDIDYSKRRRIAAPATAAAKDAAGFPVDVLVTDRPEWEIRTTQVRTSLEAWAARTGMVLVDRRTSVVDWDKEMVMPTDDYREALYRLGHVGDTLEVLHRHLSPSPLQAVYVDLGDVENAHLVELGRMLALGGFCQSVVEASVKALIHLTAQPHRRPWGHKIEDLCQELPSPTREHVVERVLHPVKPEEFTPWHRWSRYHERGKDPEPVAEVVDSLIRGACRVAAYTADQFGAEPRTRAVRVVTVRIDEFLDTHDLESGRPLPGRPGPETPRLGF